MTEMIQGTKGRNSNFCYHKIVVLSVKQNSVIWKWMQISCKCILQTAGQLGEKMLKTNKSSIDMLLKKGEKCNCNCPVKTTKHRKRVEDKNKNRAKIVTLKNNNRNKCVYIER